MEARKPKQEQEVEIEEDKQVPYFIEKAIRPAYDEYFGTETIEVKQARLRCLLLGIDFVILARPCTF